MVDTTIKIDLKLKKRLDKFKIHPRQSYNEVLDLLIIHCEKAIRKGDLKIFKEAVI